MPPKKTIIINDDSILAAIRKAWQADVGDVQAAAAIAAAEYEQDRAIASWERLADLRHDLRGSANGIRCDLARFWGREPTASERIRLQQCIRRLEAAGKVVRSTVYIKPVDGASA